MTDPQQHAVHLIRLAQMEYAPELKAAMEAGAEALSRSQGWQPIATCPYAVDDALVVSSGSVYIMHHVDGEWFMDDERFWPECWMPLPLPPVTAKEPTP